MRIDLDNGVSIFIPTNAPDARLDELLAAVLSTREDLYTMSESQNQRLQQIADRYTAAAARLDSVEDSVTTVMQGVPEMIRVAVADAVAQGVPENLLAALSAAADKIEGETQKIAEAVIANTPAQGGSEQPQPAPEPAPQPVPEPAPVPQPVPEQPAPEPAPEPAPTPVEPAPAEPAPVPVEPTPEPAPAPVEPPPLQSEPEPEPVITPDQPPPATDAGIAPNRG